MKPKNKFQKRIFEASKKLPHITCVQERWAYQNCFEHIGVRTKKGVITCLECGASWQSVSALSESTCESTCPNCRAELKIQDTLKRVFRDNQYFCIITRCEGFQVLRFFYLRYSAKTGESAKYDHSEVVQQWIAPNGRHEIIARLQPGGYYGSSWNFTTFLEIRPKQPFHNINPAYVYPRRRLIPEIERSGFNGNFYKLTPFDLFSTLLSHSKAETLLKVGQIGLLQYFTNRGFRHIEDYWASIKIAIRNGYQINDASIWCDYIDLLRFFGKDLHSAKYVCPVDLIGAHDRYVSKKREWQERLRIEEAKKRALEEEACFRAKKGRFFGIHFTDGLIQIRVLDSVIEIMQEGDEMHHCVFTNSYHLKPDSLILSASIGDRRVETIELSLSKMKILQSRGKCNKNSEYHERIIELVNKNILLIKKRLAA